MAQITYNTRLDLGKACNRGTCPAHLVAHLYQPNGIGFQKNVITAQKQCMSITLV